MTPPDAPHPAGEPDAPGEPTSPHSDVHSLPMVASRLQSQGHQILTRAGKLFISEASKLSSEDRAYIKRNREAFIALAEPWLEESIPLVTTITPGNTSSLADFLGRSELKREPSWKPGEFPNLTNAKNIILNFETNGLDIRKHDPIGVAVGTLDGECISFLPWGFLGGGNLPKEQVIAFLKGEIKHKHITNPNIRFDVHMGNRIGVDFEAQGNTTSDIMHTAALLDDHRKRFALDVLAKDFLGGIEIPRIDESNMVEYPAWEVAARAEYQIKLVSQLREKMWPHVVAQDLLDVHQLEDEVIYPVCEMERNGAPIDVEKLYDYKHRCEQKHQQLLMEISREVGFQFDCTNSAWIRLFEKLHLTVIESEKGKPSFKEEVLNDFDHPLVRKGQLASQYASLNSKTFTPYVNNIVDGILPVAFTQLKSDGKGTVSGRFSAPYVHQVPNAGNHKKVFGNDLYPRDLFIPGEGEYLESDARQIQYRIFAHWANNPTVIERYQKDPLLSFHKETWAEFIKFKPDMIYENQKTLNFMKIFGGGLPKTAMMMGIISSRVMLEIQKSKTQRTDPRLDPAREIENVYNRVLPEVKPLLQMSSHLAMSHCDDWCNKSEASRNLHKRFPHRGFVTTIMKRRARFPQNFSLHKALNRVIQGTEADIVKHKLVRLHKMRKETGFKMRLCTHDAVGGDALNTDTKVKVSQILNEQDFPQLRVKILWDTNTGASWAKCK